MTTNAEWVLNTPKKLDLGGSSLNNDDDGNDSSDSHDEDDDGNGGEKDGDDNDKDNKGDSTGNQIKGNRKEGTNGCTSACNAIDLEEEERKDEASMQSSKITLQQPKMTEEIRRHQKIQEKTKEVEQDLHSELTAFLDRAVPPQASLVVKSTTPSPKSSPEKRQSKAAENSNPKGSSLGTASPASIAHHATKQVMHTSGPTHQAAL